MHGITLHHTEIQEAYLVLKRQTITFVLFAKHPFCSHFRIETYLPNHPYPRSLVCVLSHLIVSSLYI